MSRLIYLDNAATTQVYPEVLEAMTPFFTEFYGNPSSVYSFAGKAGRSVLEARETLASVIGTKTKYLFPVVPQRWMIETCETQMRGS